MSKHILMFAAMLLLILCSCDPQVRPGIGITAPAGNSIAKAQAYNQVARQQAEDGKKSGGKSFFSVIDRVLELQAETLDAASSENQVAGRQHQEVVDQLTKARTENKVLYESWGAKTERFLRRVWFWIKVAFVVHVLAGIAGLFVPGIWGKGIAIIGAIANPFAWFQVIRDNLYFRQRRPELKSSRRKR